MISLADALMKNSSMSRHLNHLNLSNNKIGKEASLELSKWLGQMNNLKSINISYTNPFLEMLFPAMERGCHKLTELLMAGCQLSSNTDFLVSFVRKRVSLTSFDLSFTGGPSQLYVSLLTSASSQKLHINIRGN